MSPANPATSPSNSCSCQRRSPPSTCETRHNNRKESACTVGSTTTATSRKVSRAENKRGDHRIPNQLLRPPITKSSPGAGAFVPPQRTRKGTGSCPTNAWSLRSALPFPLASSASETETGTRNSICPLLLLIGHQEGRAEGFWFWESECS